MKNTKSIIIASTFLAFIGSLFLFSSKGHALFGFGSWGKYQTVQVENGLVQIPVNEVNDGKAHYYTLEAQGKKINFFVLQSQDGVIRAAFDACDVCFSEKKGYTQGGDFMICNNCGQRFHSSKINVIQGGCNPAPLRRTNNGQQIVIAASDIFSGYYYF